ncbi:hypothetical protein QZM68_13390 [Burkholderia gladioli]|uniref:hypothetical protein n=1 Tax=Burkholderia gladioli TaxID=28095 RepID=UPI00264F99DA|nr:hypothetical protein [Burkholderia gladioli]MDN7600754.1 hypothetical protein [Burkholderia gladioli]
MTIKSAREANPQFAGLRSRLGCRPRLHGETPDHLYTSRQANERRAPLRPFPEIGNISD